VHIDQFVFRVIYSQDIRLVLSGRAKIETKLNVIKKKKNNNNRKKCKQNHFSRTTNNYYRVHNLRCRRIHTFILYIIHTQKCYTILLFSWYLPVGFSKFHVCGLYLDGVFVQQQ